MRIDGVVFRKGLVQGMGCGYGGYLFRRIGHLLIVLVLLRGFLGFLRKAVVLFQWLLILFLRVCFLFLVCSYREGIGYLFRMFQLRF
jgi:hypothetical protein